MRIVSNGIEYERIVDLYRLLLKLLKDVMYFLKKIGLYSLVRLIISLLSHIERCLQKNNSSPTVPQVRGYPILICKVVIAGLKYAVFL